MLPQDRDLHGWTSRHPQTLYDLTDRLRTRGWQVPAYPLPPDRQDTVIQRVLVRHGIGHDKLALLADDIEREVKRLQAVEPGGSVAPQETGFHH